jgi:hypothetical protein
MQVIVSLKGGKRRDGGKVKFLTGRKNIRTKNFFFVFLDQMT